MGKLNHLITLIFSLSKTSLRSRMTQISGLKGCSHPPLLTPGLEWKLKLKIKFKLGIRWKLMQLKSVTSTSWGSSKCQSQRLQPEKQTAFRDIWLTNQTRRYRHKRRWSKSNSILLSLCLTLKLKAKTQRCLGKHRAFHWPQKILTRMR